MTKELFEPGEKMFNFDKRKKFLGVEFSRMEFSTSHDPRKFVAEKYNKCTAVFEI